MYTTMPIIIACLEMFTPPPPRNFHPSTPAPVILILISAMPWANKIHVLYGLSYMGGRETLMHDQLMAVIARHACSLVLMMADVCRFLHVRRTFAQKLLLGWHLA